MEYLAPIGIVGFVLAAHLFTEVKKLKEQVAELEQKMNQLQNEKGD